MAHFLQMVTPVWVKQKLQEYGLEQKDLVIALNVDKSHVSNWLSGSVNMSKPVRAALYYYFEAKKRGM